MLSVKPLTTRWPVSAAPHRKRSMALAADRSHGPHAVHLFVPLAVLPWIRPAADQQAERIASDFGVL